MYSILLARLWGYITSKNWAAVDGETDRQTDRQTDSPTTALRSWELCMHAREENFSSGPRRNVTVLITLVYVRMYIPDRTIWFFLVHSAFTVRFPRAVHSA